MYKLKYFKYGNSICGDDFKLKEEFEYINLNHISSISGLKNFTLFSGTSVGTFSTVKMMNGDIFFIKPEEQIKLLNYYNIS